MANYNPVGSTTPLGISIAITPISVSVTNSSTQIVAENEDRRFLLLSNTGNIDVFLSGDGTAQLNKGFELQKGESIMLGEIMDITTSIHGITNAGSTNIACQEFE